jgi:hypothetical protein
MGRDVIGGPAPSAVRKMIKNLKTGVEKQEKRRETRLANLRQAEEKLFLAESSLKN